jgi:hypothetical protein
MRRLASAFLIVLVTSVLVAATTPALATQDDERHTVTGFAYTEWEDDLGEGYWQHRYDVVGTASGAHGTIWEEYVDFSPADGYKLNTRAFIDVDCLEVDIETKEAWIGGHVVAVKGGVQWIDGTYEPWSDYLYGYAVYYVDDNRDNSAPDVHGDILIGEEWGTAGLTCHDRVAPWFPDPSSRGQIVVN